MRKMIVFSLVLILAACSSEEIIDISTESSYEQKKPKSLADGRYDVLGYGYDLTGEYMDYTNFKYAVVDIEAFRKANPTRLDTINSHVMPKAKFVYGESMEEYIKNLSYSINANVSSNFFSFEVFSMSASFIKEAKEQKKGFDAFASYEIGKIIWQGKLNTDANRLKPYLTSDFKEDLYKLGALKLIETYGMIVVTDVKVGGRADLRYSCSTSSSRKQDVTKAGLGGKMNFLGIKGGINGDLEIDETLAKEVNNYEFHCTTTGGHKSIIGTIDPKENTLPSITIAEWMNSITRRNCVPYEINLKSAVPLFELIDDPIKKEEIRQATYTYIEKQKHKAFTTYLYYVEKYSPKIKSYYLTYEFADAHQRMFLNPDYYLGEVYIDKLNSYDSNLASLSLVTKVDVRAGADIVVNADFYACSSNIKGAIPIYVYEGILYPKYNGRNDKSSVFLSQDKLELGNYQKLGLTSQMCLPSSLKGVYYIYP